MTFSKLSLDQLLRGAALALLAAVLAFSTSASIMAAAHDATSITFQVKETNCGVGTSYSFYVGTTLAGTITPGYDCTCGAAVKSVTTTDATLLALVNGTSPSNVTFRVDISKQYYFSWATAVINRPAAAGGPETFQIKNHSGIVGDTYACRSYGSQQNFSYSSVWSCTDTDGDTTCNYADSDSDNDGVTNTADNCSLVANTNQANNDGDSQGDACDTDDDNDTKLDTADNCPFVANTNQANFDGDALGDACETDVDIDSDGVLNAADNCPAAVNPTQADNDGDGQGDACDTDDDNDTKLDTADNCPFVANTNQANADGDATGDACETDDDNDGFADTVDNCPVNNNADQANLDGDAFGNVCDTDDDGDTKLDTADNCPFVANATQTNSDGDAYGDACDVDDDGDGVLNAADNCRLDPNPNQANGDGDASGDVCDTELRVRTVPWLGLPNKSHEVIPGGTIVLQGMATQGLSDTPAAGIVRATWDAGDGTVIDVSFANPLVLELEHAYTGVAVGSTITATLTVELSSGVTASDTFKVAIKAAGIDAEANMAIDKGLWYLHKQMVRSTVGGVKTGWITHTDAGRLLAATSGGVQAFEINNHLANGNVAEDPYVHDVGRILRWLETQLVVQTLNSQLAGNPDTNGNGIGITANFGNQNYVTGQVMDALIASGTPDAHAVLGPVNVVGRTYEDILQDMIDYNAWAQIDVNPAQRGSWYYTPTNNTSTGHGDNSIGQWPAIGGIAAERVWGLTTPDFVKSENIPYLRYTQQSGGTSGGMSIDGNFGYSGPGFTWNENSATTPSAIVQYIYDGVRNDPAATDDDSMRFQRGLKYMARYQRVRNNYQTGNNIYGLYATAKAYRLALDANGDPDPIELVDDDPADGVPEWDWYRNDPAAGAPASAGPKGMARAVIEMQTKTGTNVGRWAGGGSGTWTNTLSSAWGVIILSPTLFQLGPEARCSPLTTTIGRTGQTIAFDAGSSTHNDPDGMISSYSWSFSDGGTASGPTASHTYPSRSSGFPFTYTATVTVTDTNGLTDSASCEVIQDDDNPPPTPIITGGDSITFCQGTSLIFDASGSTDVDADGNPTAGLTFEWDWSGTNIGDFSPAPDSTSPTPDATAAFSARPPGLYEIALRVTDQQGASATIGGSVTVKAANDPDCNQPPVANDQSVSTNEDTPLNGTLTASDPDAGDTLTFSHVGTGPSHGSVVVNANGTFSYTPADDYFGPDSFEFSVSDGEVSDTGTVTITVTSVNDAPVADDGSNATNEDTSVGGTVTGSDLEGDDLVFSGTGATAHGSVVVNGDGTYTYTPAANYNGPDSFTFTVTDENGGSDTGTVSLIVNPVNDAPVANDGSNTTNEDTAVGGTVTGSDVDGDSLTFSGSGTTANGGSFSVSSNGSYTYTPAANYNGPDSFTFSVSDGNLSDTGTVTIEVAPQNDGPVANDAENSTNEDTPIGGTVTATDIDGDGLTFSGSGTTANGGSYSVNADGTYTYSPAPNFNGTDSFTFAVSDGTAGDTGTVTIAVAPLNDAPVANDSGNTTNEDQAVGGTVTGSDIDAGDSLTFSGSGSTGNGTFEVNPDGSYTYTPNPNYNGPDSFTFTVTDESGASAEGTVSMLVNPVNDGPEADDSSNATNEDTTVTGTVTGSDIDAGDSLTFSGSGTTANGTFSVNPDGSYSYTPNPNYNGPDSFTFTVTDSAGATATGTVTLTVNPVNDAPVAVDDGYTTDEDTLLLGVVTTNDTDIDGDYLTASLVTDVAHGTLVLNPDGSFTYMPALNYNGPDFFTYRVSDGTANSNIATVNINVTPVNDNPVCTLVSPTVGQIWPPNHRMVSVGVNGVTDVDSGAATITVTGIFQDESTNTQGDGNTSSDGAGLGTSTALVRAERSGTPRTPGDGRVYHVFFTATDSSGGSCTGEVTVGVPHDQGQRRVPVDGGVLFNSVTGAAVEP